MCQTCVRQIMSEIDVPQGHDFARLALLTWELVPPPHQPSFCLLLPMLWRYRGNRRIAKWAVRYFRLVVPLEHDTQPLEQHLLQLGGCY